MWCSYFICEFKHYFSVGDQMFLKFYIKDYSLFQKAIIDKCVFEYFYALIILDREIELVETYLVTAWKGNSQ